MIRVDEAVIIGAGKVAERKAKTLAELGVKVTVIAPEEPEWIREIPDATFIQACVQDPEDLPEADLYITATDDPELNRTLEENLPLVNRVDTPDPKVKFPSILAHRDAIVAVSTGKPRVTRALRMILAEKVRNELKRAGEAPEELREKPLEHTVNVIAGVHRDGSRRNRPTPPRKR